MRRRGGGAAASCPGSIWQRRSPSATATLALLLGASLGEGVSYDCSRSWWLPVSALFGQGWPQEQKDWCCAHAGVECPAATPAPTPSPPPSDADGESFGCHEGLDHWEETWTKAKKRWCCEHEKLGCELRGAPAVSFDCQADLSHWEGHWSGSKKAWCCETHGLGCATTAAPTHAAPKTFECHTAAEGGDDNWTEERRTWCCMHYEKACNIVITATSTPTLTTTPTFDCRYGADGSITDWSAERRSWCCLKFDRGCATVTDTLTTTATATTTTATPSTTVSPPYLCRGYPEAWPPDQQAWCCEHEAVGCTPCDTICDSNDVSASCRSRITWLQSHDPPPSAEPCVAAHDKVLQECSVCSRCDVDDTCPLPLNASSLYHCTIEASNQVENWPPGKRSWCCHYRQTGCPTTTTTTPMEVYDCTVPNVLAASRHVAAWPRAQRAWCCRRQHVGCTACDLPCTLQGLAATCRERVQWLVTHDFARMGGVACRSSRQVVLDQCGHCGACELEDACPGAVSATFAHDCEGGSRDTWTTEKQVWCCIHEGKFCGMTATSTATVTRTATATATHTTTTEAASDEEYDCKEGYARWWTDWSVVKQAWCCVEHGLGCRLDQDCTNGEPSDWTPDKRTWCCEHAPESCPTTTTTTRKTTTTTKTHTSTKTATSTRTTTSTRTVTKTVTATRTATSTTTTPQPTSTKTTTTATATTTATTTTTQATTTTLPYFVPAFMAGSAHNLDPPPPPPWLSGPDPFDCFLDLGNWQSKWSADKLAWCCKAGAHRPCPLGAVGAKKAAAPPPRFECSGPPTHWPAERRRWCCKHRGRGCQPELQAPLPPHTVAAEGPATPSPRAALVVEDDDRPARPLASSGKHAASPSTAKAALRGKQLARRRVRVGPRSLAGAPGSTTTTGAANAEVADMFAGRASDSAEAISTDEDDCLEFRVSYTDRNVPLRSTGPAGTPTICRAMCQRTPGCTFFTFVSQGGVCELADALAEAKAAPEGTLSGTAECPGRMSFQALTWRSKEALPISAGTLLEDSTLGVGSIGEMKAWCEANPNCVGFSLDMSTGSWFPRQAGTGFDPRIASWLPAEWGQPWRWYYIQERVPRDRLT